MNSSKYFAVFCVQALYYLPHFMPVAHEMKRRGLPHAWLFSDETRKNSVSIIHALGLNLIEGTPEKPEAAADFFIFGNSYNRIDSIPGLTVLIYHGIGTKACYYETDLNRFDIRFVEGAYRRKELDSRSPDSAQECPVVGFSKLDPVADFSQTERKAFLVSLGLDPSLKTVLYAPTYYPSSIERMGARFPEDCDGLNLLLKPHQFSYERRYRRQFKVLQNWGKRNNVYLAKQADFNILPFFKVSDVMVSDESSAIFEFAALGKPVIRNRFVSLRISYRLFPWKLRKRMDPEMERYSGIAQDAHDYNATIRILRDVLAHPMVNQPDISRYSRELLGEVDGKVSERIVDYLLSRLIH